MVQQKSILYIDDQVNQLSFKALFRRKFPIFTTEGLVEAKLILSQHPVGMVLFNQHLPYIATFEFLQWFVAEQREEEAQARKALDLFHIIDKEGIEPYTIDKALAKLA